MIIGFSFLFFANVSAKEPLIIKIRSLSKTSSNYIPSKEYKYQLLQLILGKTEDTEGPFRIELEKDWVTQARNLQLVKQGYLSLIMTMTSKEREQDFHPIRIPVFKGMYGYRLAIINRNDQKMFSAIKT